YEANTIGASGLKDQLQDRRECISCFTRNSPQFYNTKIGLLCRSCFGTKRKDGSLKVAPNNSTGPDEQMQQSGNAGNSKGDMMRLPKDLTPLITDRNVLNEIAREREISMKSKVLDS